MTGAEVQRDLRAGTHQLSRPGSVVFQNARGHVEHAGGIDGDNGLGGQGSGVRLLCEVGGYTPSANKPQARGALAKAFS